MHVESRDALEFLYPDSLASKRPCRVMTVDVARGGTGSVHILLNGLSPEKTVRFAVRHNGNVVRNAEWFRLVDVPVEVNSGPSGFVEQEGERNQFVARRAPFRVFDAMQPIRRSVRALSPTMALRLHLPVGVQKEGQREYSVEIQHDKETHSLTFGMNIHKAVIRPAGKESFPYTNWFSFDMMAERHGLKPWSEPHWRMIRSYAKLMVHARQNTFLVPLEDVFAKRSRVPILNRKRLRRIVRLFTEEGMHFIEGGHVAQRPGSWWEAPAFDIGLTGVRGTSVEGNASLAGIASQLMAEIELNGWQSRWLQHVADEPIAENAADYRILAGMVRRHMPGIRILDATMDPTLAGSVDIWCPQAHEYQKHRKEFVRLQALGDGVWFYTCCFPCGPWLNRVLDMELLRPTLLGWAAALFRLDGFLHWGLNQYKPWQDPFTASVVDHGGSNRLPAGDTHIVYPGAGRPWSSVRLEAQREGFEDYELLRKLRSQDAKVATSIIRKAIRGFDKYTKSVKTFRAARRAMLDALAD